MAKTRCLQLLGLGFALGACATPPSEARSPRRDAARKVAAPTSTLQPVAAQAPPAPPTVAATPAAPQHSEPNVDGSLAALTKAASRRLRDTWCQRTEPAQAPGCDAVQVSVPAVFHPSCEEGACVEAASFSLLSVHLRRTLEEDHLFLLLPTTQGATLFELADGQSSGVGAFSHEVSLSHIGSADVFGDAGLEWWAVTNVSSHDTDMGDCAERGDVERRLVLCTSSDGAPRCAAAPLTQLHYDEVHPDTEGLGCARPRHEQSGFDYDATVMRNSVHFAPRQAARGARRITRGTPAPWRGTVAIATLLDKARLGAFDGSSTP